MRSMNVQTFASHQSKHGFTIFELLVALAIVLTLGAVTLSTFNPIAESDVDRARLAAEKLNDIHEAINGFEPTLRPTSFKQNMITISNTKGVNPLRLSDLTTKISSVVGAANSQNSCGNTYLAAEVTNWSSTGPYWDGVVSNGQVVLAPGFVANDLMVVTQVDPANFGSGVGSNIGQYLAIRMPSVALEDAQNLAELVDGDETGVGTLRTVKFTAAGSNPVSVDYIVLINGC